MLNLHREAKARLRSLQQQNALEVDLLFKPVRVKGVRSSKSIKLEREQRRLVALIRAQQAVKAQGSEWGLHSHLVTYRIKIRTLEHVIYQLQQGKQHQRSPLLMQRLIDQTCQDLRILAQQNRLLNDPCSYMERIDADWKSFEQINQACFGMLGDQLGKGWVQLALSVCLKRDRASRAPEQHSKWEQTLKAERAPLISRLNRLK